MVTLALELGHDDLVDVEEPVLLEADLDERRLHPGQNVVDDAEVDVAGDRPALGPLEVDLGDAIVLDHGDALLADVDRDQQLALRGRQRRPAWRLPATLGAAALASGPAPVGGALGALAPRRLLLRCVRCGLLRGRRSRHRLLRRRAASGRGRHGCHAAACFSVPRRPHRLRSLLRSCCVVACCSASGSAGAAGVSVTAPSGASCFFLFFHRNQGK